MKFEYKVVPAPKKGKRVKGVKGAEARFANTLSDVMNEYGAEGWEYQRTDTLPCETRSGLTGKTTVFQNMLVFRRALDVAEDTAPEAPQVDVEEIATVHAPALPSAGAAQELPDYVAPVNDDEKRDVAAE
ncbi:DUF4177 domain-containing protein [Aliiroseovarius subalbicans]|uniref:DUF4177 domain-containing protein n=1 Tax=Aliiroseovarius subalbicans TaxID=2925840 RepID=UPI001F56F8C2|nr:DUF4177 domain-containing protein [Aliiroseovarius subalbicans]MCI2398614.1 DUF4177 domain-containing protein [Aliiroseovarius subalbicans]